ncbi:hypothetical protein AB3329_01785 [Streptococcus sp. H31]|uniref:hypothetical protein n=1 Tax=Streptococcus huangxiaojuni TaxID=3237239 RepID=UPI0034A330A1
MVVENFFACLIILGVPFLISVIFVCCVSLFVFLGTGSVFEVTVDFFRRVYVVSFCDLLFLGLLFDLLD